MALKKANKYSWMMTLWTALHEVEPQSDGTRANGDIISFDEWDDICTAMAWIAEELGLDPSEL
jgi:hypothetical protein